MSRIKDDPNPNYDFGYDFNYDVWTANTTITLTNVPWNNDYRDIVSFDSNEDLNAYIDQSESTNVNITNTSYARLGSPVKINIPFSKAMKYNYLRAVNPAQPIPGSEPEEYYYFILGVNRSAGNTTEIIVELDVWQSFGRKVTFGNCYVERSHFGIAAQNNFDSFGRKYLTIPEALDIGSDMITVKHYNEQVMRGRNLTVTSNTIKIKEDYDILITSSTDLNVTPDKDDPKVKAPYGDRVQNIATGAFIGVLQGLDDSNPTITLFEFLMKFQETPWIIAGISSITIVPKIKRYAPEITYQANAPTRIGTTGYAPKQYSLLNNWRNNSSIVNAIPARYRHLKKFFTFPYMAIELTTNTGSSVILRPEMWNHPDLAIMERASYMPGAQRVTFHPRGYNSKTDPASYESLYTKSHPLPNVPGIGYLENVFNKKDGDDGGDYLGTFTSISSFPQVPISNDNAAIALATNKSSIAAQRSNANWASQRATLNANAAMQSTRDANWLDEQLEGLGIDTDRTALGITQQLQNDTALSNTISNILGGGSAGLTGGLPGAAMGIGTQAVNSLFASHNLGLQQNAASQQLANSHGSKRQAGNLSRDMNTKQANANWKLARDVSGGDYEAAIEAIDAQVQALQMTPPSLSGQFGGDAMNLIHDGLVLSARIKMIDENAISRVGEFWLRYGYSIHRFMKPPQNLHAMSKFTYWKMKETYITGAPMPEFFKQVIRGILEKGVTVWQDPADIGTIDLADNEALNGMIFS